MPIEYQKLFFFGRHNLSNLFDVLEKLAFMGLVSFENIRKQTRANLLNQTSSFSAASSKDVYNIFVHKNGSILDTRECEPAKMFIREDQINTFSRHHFKFHTIEDVELFWSELQNICTQTPLNRRIYDTTGNELNESTVGEIPLGKNNHIDRSKQGYNMRKDWFENHISRDIDEADDSGFPPGDGRGLIPVRLFPVD